MSGLRSSSRNFWTSSLTLAFASLAFMVPGLVRTKTAASLLNFDSLAMIGQLGQMQTLLISTGAAGVVTAARVVLARRNLTDDVERSLKNWFLVVPFSVAAGLALIVVLAASPISGALLGTESRASVIAAASLGVPVAVYGQIALAIAQVRASTKKLLLSAAIAAGIGGVLAGGLVASGNDALIALSFIATPLVQVCAISIFCVESRPSWGSKPVLGSGARVEVFTLAWGSAVLGIWASLAETAARSVVVQNHGLSALASYQPVVLLVTQLTSIALSSVATAALVEVGQIRDKESLSLRIDQLVRGLFPVVFALLCLGMTFSPILIRIFFTEALVRESVMLVMLALSAEIVRAYAWMIGSCLLPQGLRSAWLMNGMFTVAVQGGIGIYLGSTWGAAGLVAGMIAGSLFSAVFTLFLVRRNNIRVSPMNFIISLSLALLLAVCALAFWQWDPLARVAGLLLAALSVGYLVLNKRKKHIR